MSIPARVRLSRTKGFRLQEHAPGAIVVRRPTRWGNPFTVADAMEDEPTLTELEARERCTSMFDLWLEGDLELTDPLRIAQREWILGHLGELAGHPLACTCPLPEPDAPDWCHGAVLIRRSNRPGRRAGAADCEDASVKAADAVPSLLRPERAGAR